MMVPLHGGTVAAVPAASAPQQPPLIPVAANVPRVEPSNNTSPAASKPPLAQPAPVAAEKLASPPAGATLGSKGMTALERESALQLMAILSKYKEADPFRRPVDWEALNIPDYPTIIKQPMDLGTVREKLRSGAYSSMDAWKADMALIWANCKKYNGETHPYARLAEKLSDAMDRRMDEAVRIATAELQQRSDPSRGAKLKPARDVATPRMSVHSDDSQEDVKPVLPRVASAARLAPTPRQSDQARASESAPGGLKRVNSVLDSLTAAAAAGNGGGNGRAAKRAKISHAAGGANLAGVDMGALDQLVNTPAARSLGARRPEQLAFLQLWKNLVSSEEAAVTEAEAQQQGNKKLRRQLAAADEQIRDLRVSLETEVQTRRAAEDAAKQLKADYLKLQREHKQQNYVLEHQKQLLEQQQQVIRQVLGQKNQQQQQQQQEQPQQARAAAPAVLRQESPALAAQQQPAPPPVTQQQQRPQPQQQPVAGQPAQVQHLPDPVQQAPQQPSSPRLPENYFLP